MKTSLFSSLGLLLMSTLAGAGEIDQGKLEQAMKGDGLVGRVHGSALEYGLFVFTYRDPQDFFSHLELPVASYGEGVLSQLKALNRHDKIRIRGEFIKSHAPLIHLTVNSLDVLERWSDGYELPVFERSPERPVELLKGTELVGKVHAVDGSVLVVDWHEMVLPVYFKNSQQTLGLHRGDRVQLKYRAQANPGRPVHLIPLDIQVLDSVVLKDKKKLTIEGAIVFYPKSPQISVDVFAVEEVDQTGVALDYTLVNFEDPEVFKKIREKLKAAWDEKSATAVRSRNKLYNSAFRIRATGIGNVVDPNQANPQILLEGPESIEIL